MSIPVKSIIAGPSSAAPTATLSQSGVIDGGTKKAVDRYNAGRYLLRTAVSIGTDATPAPTYYAY